MYCDLKSQHYSLEPMWITSIHLKHSPGSLAVARTFSFVYSNFRRMDFNKINFCFFFIVRAKERRREMRRRYFQFNQDRTVRTQNRETLRVMIVK